MDENNVKFQEKLKELVAALAKKKRTVLENQEINDFSVIWSWIQIQMEKVFDYLEANDIDVLRIRMMTMMMIWMIIVR